MENQAEVLAAAARTLERMRTYVETVAQPDRRAAAFHELSQIPIEALATMNPAEAEHAVETVLRGSPAGRCERTVVCASRASALAMTQTRMVASRLARLGIATTILNVTTTGDRVQDRSLAAIGSQNLFVKELELALREGRADYAVHSCKDLPSELPADMQIAAISAREDARDAFCSERYAGFDALPPGARVGTSSMRRRAQLASMRPDLEYADIRGNVDTRLRKLRDGDYDAIVLACAGLQRLGLRATHTVPFAVDELVPAVAQGALAVETHSGAESLSRLLREAVNDDTAERAVLCERAALRVLQGGCQAPIGIHARFEGGELLVEGVVTTIDGTAKISEKLRGEAADAEQAHALGEALANALLRKGAGELLALPKENA